MPFFIIRWSEQEKEKKWVGWSFPLEPTIFFFPYKEKRKENNIDKKKIKKV